MEENKDVNVNENKDTENQNDLGKTYTAEEIQKLLQTETDRKVSLALKKQADKYEKKLSLSQLDGDARDKAEKDQRIAELEEQIKNFNVLTQKNEVMKTLGNRGLPTGISDFLNITDDAESNQQIIEGFDKAFKEAVKAEVEKRMSTSVPKKNLPLNETLTKESFKKMSLQEQAELYKTNPELYKTLII